MRRNITTARNRGVHLGFFGANTCYWQIRLDPSPLTGQPRRTIACYRDRFKDPLFGIDNSRVTELWRSDIVNRPEEQLIGVQYDFFPVDGDLVVDNANHFIFEGTGLHNGDRLPGLLGYEADRTFGGGPSNLIRLCYSPIIPNTGLRSGPPRNAISGTGARSSEELQKISQIEQSNTNAPGGGSEMTIYKAPSGALVFATGSMQFNWGLDDGTDSARTHLVNPAAQQMVRNLFRRFI